MASRTGTVKSVVALRGDDDIYPAETTGILKTYAVQVQNDTSSTVIGGTDTLDVATLGATIKSWLRTNKTITVAGADGVALGKCAVVGGTSYSATVAMSSTTLQITPKAVSDHSTGATLPANTSVTQRPYTILVTVYES